MHVCKSGRSVPPGLKKVHGGFPEGLVNLHDHSWCKGPHAENDNRIKSSESHINLCMYGVIVLPKVADFYFDRILSTPKSKLMVAVCIGALRDPSIVKNDHRRHTCQLI